MKAVIWVIQLEIGIWKSLFLFLARRTAGKRPGDVAFAYNGHLFLVLFGFIFASLCELPLLHVIIPWEKVRLAADILSIWGLLWMFGYAASLKVFPHLMTPQALRVRHGSHLDIAVPWDAIESVNSKRRDTEKDRFQLVDGLATVALLKETNIDVVLRRPVPTPKGEATELRFHVDDPKALVTAARARLSAHAG